MFHFVSKKNTVNYYISDVPMRFSDKYINQQVTYSSLVNLNDGEDFGEYDDISSVRISCYVYHLKMIILFILVQIQSRTYCNRNVGDSPKEDA